MHDLTWRKNLTERLLACKEQVHEICQRCDRNPQDVQILLASKTRTPEELHLAWQLGFHAFGENRIQEALPKVAALAEILGDTASERGPSWHFIGHLQSNKARQAIAFSELIHSLDRRSLAQALQLQCALLERVQPLPVLIQVNTSGEASKGGLAPHQVVEFVGSLCEFDRLQVVGLMTLAQPNIGELRARAEFASLRTLMEQLRTHRMAHVDMRVLSMGMSQDYPWAIAEGATLIRLGTAAFGTRE